MAQKNKQVEALEQQVGELTADLQRVQADFVNYRRRIDEERRQVIDTAKAATILKLLPVIDNIERAIGHLPDELADNKWAQGIASLSKGLDKSLVDLEVTRIEAVGQPFNPELHEAIGVEDGGGDHEVVTEELRGGYKLGDQVIRHSLVKVTRQAAPQEDGEEDGTKQTIGTAA